MKRSVSVAGFYLVFLVCFSLSSAAQTKAGGLSPDEIKDQLYKDSLERALATAPDSTKLKLLYFLDQAYISSNPTKSLEYEKKRLAVAEKLNNLHVQASAYIGMSRPALYKNDIPDAKIWLERGYTLAEKRKDSALMLRALLNLGAVSQASSDQTATLDDYLRALRIAKAIRDTPMMNMSSMNISTVYVDEANYVKAEEYTLPVLSLIDSTRGDPQQAPKAMEILGVIYFKENKFALAWQYYRNSLRLYAKQKNDQGMATIYSHLAGFYLNKPDSMLYFAFKAKAIWDRINPDYFMAGENIGNFAAAYYSMATYSLHPAK